MSWWSLPEDWDTVLLGPLVKIKSGFACAKKNLVPANQGIAHLRPFNIATNGKVDLSEVYYIPTDYKDGTEAYALEPGHVLFNNTNSVELVGKTALVTEPMQCVFSNHIYRLTVKAKARLDPTWLALTLRALWTKSYFAEYCNRWIGQAGFNQKMLRDLEIPVPHPDDPARSLETQRRIVARIEGLFAELGAARRLHAALAHDAERLMDAALADTFDISKNHHETNWKTIGQIGDVIGGLTKNRKRKSYSLKLPYLRVANVYANELRLDDVQIIGVRKTELDRLLLQHEDLLVVEGNGSINQIGRVAVWDGSIEPCVHQNHIIKVRLGKSVDSKYALYWLLSPQGRDEIVKVASSTSGLYTLSLSKVSALPIPLVPLSQQRQKIDYLDDMQARAAELQRTIDAVAADLDRLEQSILAQTFEGKL